MGPAQLAGVMTIVGRQAAAARGQEFDEAGRGADGSLRRVADRGAVARAVPVRMLYDDGVIDPRDTRTVLGIALSAVHSAPVDGADNYGVFRL